MTRWSRVRAGPHPGAHNGEACGGQAGIRFGEPRKLNPLDEGQLASVIAQTFGVHVATIYRLAAA